MKYLTGKVISTKMAKTVVVAVERKRINSLYKKTFIRIKKIKAHCEDTKVKVGDIVMLAPHRPFSKEKHYQVIKIKRKEI